MKVDEILPGQRGRFTRRALLLGVGQVGLFGLLASRLYRLQVTEAPKYALLSDGNRIDVQLVAPRRGIISDRFGEPLATNAKTLQVTLVPERAKDIAAELDRLARIVTVSDEDRARALRLSSQQNGHIPILLADELTWRQFSQINIEAPSLPGILTDVGWKRVYHHGFDMGHVVGYVAPPDKVDVADDTLARVPGYRIGKVGVERGFEQELRGRAGIVKHEVDAHGRSVRELDRTDATAGRDLVLTVDHRIQHFALQRVGKERRAALVALAAETGEILALVSKPSYDPAKIVEGISENDWRALTESEDDPLNNKATRGQYPPGSTFKIVTALAGLEAGVITPKTRVECSGSWDYANHRFRCWKRHGHGSVTLHRAIKESCDVFFYETARALGIERLAEAARRLGLGQSYDCGLPLQMTGVVPDPDWKEERIGKPWYGGDTVLAGIGQGFVLTTPLQLALMTARVATGRRIEPRIVHAGASSGGDTAAKLGFKAEHLAAVRAGMRAVVNERGGTAAGVSLDIPGVQMAGKSGTSQVGRVSMEGSERLVAWHLRDHALFVAYAPVDKPRYAVATVVEHGGGGSRAAAPIVRDVMAELIRRDPLAKPAYVADSGSRRLVGPGDPRGISG